VENEQAWRVSIDQIKAGNFNLDLKNPHNPDTGPGDERTMAELSAEEKHAISHRGRAARLLARHLAVEAR